MKKTAALLLTVMMVTACVACKSTSKVIEFPKDELLSDYCFESDKPMDIIEETEQVKTVWFHRGDLKMYGMIYVPEGKGPFPVVLMTGGLGASIINNQNIAKTFSKGGIVGVVYDPVGTGAGSKSDGRFVEYTPLSVAADIESVVLQLAQLSFVDTNNIFLYGHSIGGMSSGYVAFKNPDTIKGLVLLEPSFQSNSEARRDYPDPNAIPDVIGPYGMGGGFFRDLWKFDIYDYMPSYKGKVRMYAGTAEMSIGGEMPEFLTKANELLSSSDLIFIEGANHVFLGSQRNQVIDDAIEFVNKNSKR